MEMSNFRVVLILISLTVAAVASVVGQENTANYWLERGNDSLRDGQFEEADNFFDRAVGIEPSYAKAWNLKGASLQLQGRYNDSLKAYEKAIELDQSKQSAAEAWNGKGVALDFLGEYGEAIKAYNESIKFDPKWAMPWNNLGDAFKSLGDYNKSIDAYNKAIELDPNWDAPLENKGYFLTVLGKNAEADAAFAKDGYRLVVQSVDIDGNKAYLELIKDGSVVDSKVIVAANKMDDTFAYTKPGTSQAIKIHFKNIFRGADSNLATIDSLSQTSESDPSRILMNSTHDSIIASGTNLKLEEGYELAIRSLDINGNKAYLQLTKDGSVVDSKVIVAENEVDDIFIYSKPGTSRTIKVHFKNAFRGADRNLVTVDGVQTQEIDPTRILANESHRMTISTGTPLKLDDGYELAIKAIDIDGNKAYIELLKDGVVVDSKVIIAANDVEDTFVYSKPGTSQTIKMHFKNTFRGADTNFATIDDVRQTLESDPSRILVDDSQPRNLAQGTTLELEEGYELAVRSVDIDGNKAYVELLKDGIVVDSKVIIAANEVEDTFVYSRPGASQEIKVHFRNIFRGADSNLATIDSLSQTSESDPSRILMNGTHELIITSGTTLKLAEDYGLTIKSVDIDGNRLYLELIKNGRVVESGIIIANEVDDTFIYSKPGTSQAIKVHFKNAFRGRDRNFATIDSITQTSEIRPSRLLINNTHESTILSGTILELEEGFSLAVRAIDIDGNKTYVELLKDGDVVASKLIVAANEVDDAYVYSKPGASEAIKVHFRNAFRGANQNLVTIDDTA